MRGKTRFFFCQGFHCFYHTLINEAWLLGALARCYRLRVPSVRIIIQFFQSHRSHALPYIKSIYCVITISSTHWTELRRWLQLRMFASSASKCWSILRLFRTTLCHRKHGVWRAKRLRGMRNRSRSAVLADCRWFRTSSPFRYFTLIFWLDRYFES